MATGIFKLRDQLQGLVQKAWAGTQTTPAVEYLVVAGGGAGGGGYGYSGGGGGAGGLLQGLIPVSAGTSLTVTVGAGGAQTSGDNGNPGGNSVFGSITAFGGGGGSDGQGNPGFAGGSGGGVGANSGVSGSGGQAVFGQGNAGGAGWPSTSGCAGGGGGAGAVGSSYVTYDIAGSGGAGATSSINGTITAYAGGGGGGGNVGNTGGYGGVGGGGNGCRVNYGSVASTAGTTNTGGGGGGGSNAYVSASNGGSGIVIISYPDTFSAPTTLTGTYTSSTSGSGSLSFVSPNNLNTIGTTSTWTFMSNTSALFTIEAWIYPTSAASMTIIDTCGGSSSNTGTFLGIDFSSNSKLHLVVSKGVGGSAVIDASSTGTISLNTWTHVAVTYDQSLSSNNVSFYLNGTLSGQSTKSVNTPSSGTTTYPMVVGNVNGTGAGFVGFLSNLRVVNNIVYSASFSVPKVPLIAISGTQYLLNTNSAFPFYDSSSNRYVATVTSIPTWNSLSPFTGTGVSNRVYKWTGSGTITF